MNTGISDSAPGQESRYFTTPIYYASGMPHAGHLYTTLLLQILKEHHVSAGHRVVTLTGMDEHGEKIAEKAQAAGLDPQTFVDGLKENWLSAWNAFGLSFDVFMRTTSQDHKKTVQDIWRYCHEKGDVYFGEHEGRYCVDCESFQTEKEMDEAGNCLIHRRPTEVRKEGNYYFRTTRYKDQIRDLINRGKLVRNKRYANELLGLLDALDSDLSVSRPKSRTSWGIEVPFDADHVSYVWFDALPNYVTGVGGIDSARTSALWQNAVHLLGKDILKFHGVFWPAMLLSLDLPVPELLVHGWLLQGGAKMSKSLGNVVTLQSVQSELGKDAFVNLVFRLVNPGDDLDISEALVVERYNADLANGLGNLVSRACGLAGRAFDGSFPDLALFAGHDFNERERELIRAATALPAAVRKALDDFRTADALREIWALIALTDKYLTDEKPWALVKGTHEGDQDRAQTVLALACGVIRTIGFLAYPFFPERMADLLSYLGEDASARIGFYDQASLFFASTKGRKLGATPQLFPRKEVVVPAAAHEPKQPKATVKEASKPGKAEAPSGRSPQSEGKSATAPSVTFQEFSAVQVRVGLVEKAETVEGSDKLLRLEVSLGELGVRQIFSGIRTWVRPEEIAGRKVLIAANLEPRKMRFGVSEGMVLSTESAEGQVRPVFVSDEIEPGSLLV